MKNNTPLHIAVDNERKEIIELLIAKGANMNAINIHYDSIELDFLLE